MGQKVTAELSCKLVDTTLGHQFTAELWVRMAGKKVLHA